MTLFFIFLTIYKIFNNSLYLTAILLFPKIKILFISKNVLSQKTKQMYLFWYTLIKKFNKNIYIYVSIRLHNTVISVEDNPHFPTKIS